jgi:hypothetical protein
MSDNIPKKITLTVGINESQLQFTRRVLMEAAHRIGLPLLEQAYFADFFYPLCGKNSANYRINWWAGSDPSPLDNDLTMHEAEWKTLQNKDFTLSITKEQHDELARRRDYYISRGGRLFSSELPRIGNTVADEMTYISPCTAQELLNSNFKTSIDCRADALRKLIDEIGARADLYMSEFSKVWTVLTRAVSMGGTGAGAGAVVGMSVGGVLAPAGAVLGGVVGVAVGASVGIYLAESNDAKVEARPVKNFLQRTVECSKFAKIEAQSKRELNGNAMGAGIQQILVVTKQFGIFALYPFTLKRGPTLLGDYVIEEHGANPTELVKERFGR